MLVIDINFHSAINGEKKRLHRFFVCNEGGNHEVADYSVDAVTDEVTGYTYEGQNVERGVVYIRDFRRDQGAAILVSLALEELRKAGLLAYHQSEQSS